MVSFLSRLPVGVRIALTAAPVAMAVVLVRMLSSGGDVNRFCTMIGSSSGVSLRLPLSDVSRSTRAFTRTFVQREHSFAHLRPALNRHLRSALGVRGVTVCVEGRCAVHRPVEFAGGPLVQAAVTRGGARRVGVSVTIDRVARVPQVAGGALSLGRFEPNGPGCGTWWRAAGRVDGVRVVQQRD